MAVVFFVDRYRKYLLGAEFELRVDAKALSWLKTQALRSDIIARWAQRLSPFRFSITHRSRTEHMNADALTKRTNELEVFENNRPDGPLPSIPCISEKQFESLPELKDADLKPLEQISILRRERFS